jgi:hypothetical protein
MNGYVLAVSPDGLKGVVYEHGGTGVYGTFATGDHNGNPLSREQNVTFDLSGSIAVNIVGLGFSIPAYERAEGRAPAGQASYYRFDD